MTAPSRDRPMRADGRRNYEHILATARAAFTELGPDVPLDVIARRAGLGNATVYRHFATRDVLIEAVYRPDLAGLEARADALAARHSPREALERWVRDCLMPALEQGGVATMLKDALVRAPEVFSQAKQQFTGAADGLVSAAQAAGDVRPDIPTRDILRMAYGIAVASQGAPQSRERMLTIMFDGLRPPIA
jgi:AcrR family transcriptional regulator